MLQGLMKQYEGLLHKPQTQVNLQTTVWVDHNEGKE